MNAKSNDECDRNTDEHWRWIHNLFFHNGAGARNVWPHYQLQSGLLDNSGVYSHVSRPLIPIEAGIQSGEKMSDRPKMLQEREKTHGSFARNAQISQELKCYIRDWSKNCSMEPEQWEALDMIALKLSRILSGQAHYKDHWDDIAGYAQLASESCEQKGE